MCNANPPLFAHAANFSYDFLLCRNSQLRRWTDLYHQGWCHQRVSLSPFHIDMK